MSGGLTEPAQGLNIRIVNIYTNCITILFVFLHIILLIDVNNITIYTIYILIFSTKK